MTKVICVSIPFDLLKEKYLPLVLKYRIGVEIALNAKVLDSFTTRDFKEVAKIFREEQIPVTFHLPFLDISIGSPDPMIREISLRRLYQTLDKVWFFEPLNLVFHSGYSYSYEEIKANWRELFIQNCEKLLKNAEEMGLSLSLENVYEPDPDFVKSLLEVFSGRLSWCFDPAHSRVFSHAKDEINWLKSLSTYLKEIHCHNNLGERDEHLAINKGIIRFDEIFKFLSDHEINPILTSEAHNEEDTIINVGILSNLRL